MRDYLVVVACMLACAVGVSPSQNEAFTVPETYDDGVRRPGQAATRRADRVVVPPYLGQEPPGLVPKVFAPGLISLPNRFEHDICFSKDGCECYFTVRNAGWTMHGIAVIRYENGRWTKPKQASFSNSACLCPSLADDDQSMYFSRGGGVWKARRLAPGSGSRRGWSPPRPLPAPISPPRGDWSCHISSLGNLWFCSWRPGGLGKCDLWRAARAADGRFLEAVNLRDQNTALSDCYPVPGPREEYFIWSSGREGGLGKSDLYISFADGHGGWTAPKNLGPSINTPGNESGPYLSPDYQYLFFSRCGTAPGDCEDLYWVRVQAFLPDPNEPTSKEQD